MDRSHAILDGLLTTVFVMLLLQLFSIGTVTVPVQNDAVGGAAANAGDASSDEAAARFAEMSALL